ncbi:Hpt domain-containing protein [Pseudomonas sp. ok272]|uniref:Hpt domain-containing protein n=1 Tax=unclassified Pseudomonas TaxID=196821 RepID=UPI0008C0F089|nr:MULTISPECIES: Hpt domain-containing protein [unclassified Pseudomonas]SEM72819.1 Hpt domain-containing protein [Pseudomonas sp. ok272]SFM61564.1 Hpt domain-containing protein [Pseudomonas sp. ok602]
MIEKHLDFNVLSALREFMADEYPALLDTFLKDSEERLQALHEAGDASQLIDTAHSFKGSSSNMGAVRLAQLCHELEQRARETGPATLKQLVRAIDCEFARVRPHYQAERQRFHR